MEHLMSEVRRVTHGANSKNTSTHHIKSDRVRQQLMTVAWYRDTVLLGKRKATELF